MFLENSRNAWDGALETVDCCYHPVLEYAELGDWPQIKDRQLIDRDPDTDTFLGVRFPVMEEGRPADKRNPMCEITPREALEAWS
jgi:crotonobetainyl-CoA:carnitine CoA-transferase CaiB-like acyl-CoA transferase